MLTIKILIHPMKDVKTLNSLFETEKDTEELE